MFYSSHTSRPSYRRAARPYSSSRSGGSRGGNKNVKDYINPSRFVKAATSTTTAPYVSLHAFQDFAVNQTLQANLVAKGILVPSAIQDQAIPLGLAGHDVLGIANTGTGKTIAFALPILQKLMTNPHAQALIMAPTRELAAQIEDECKAIAKGSGIRGALLIGGSSMGTQLKDLRHNPNIVIGTPGCIKDHVNRGTLNLAGFNMVVLDEVDRMLDMGFIVDMRYILTRLGTPRQSFFFSATIDNAVGSLVREFSPNAQTVTVKSGETADSVEQNVIPYSSKAERMEKLHDLLIKSGKVLIFDDTQRAVERLGEDLVARGFKADAIHGGKSQGQRQRALSRFKNSEINVLVATDVAARGIDVSDITHVVNFSTPKTYTDYVHRIGRAGRAGRTGFALTFIEVPSVQYNS